MDIFVALTEFARQKFIHGGLAEDSIVVMPNFVSPDPGAREDKGIYALFAGRLSPEKGILSLLQAWQSLQGIALKIVGDGPLMNEVCIFIRSRKLTNVEVLSRLGGGETIASIKRAYCLILPSECYETFGRVAIEAFACGVPVIASRLGAIAEIVDHGRTGLLFAPGDSNDLATKVEWAWRHEREARRMGTEARKEYELKYTAEQNYKTLMSIYERAIKNHRRKVT